VRDTERNLRACELVEKYCTNKEDKSKHSVNPLIV
jgi:hypothetical protein